MNPQIIRNNLLSHEGERVQIKIHGTRGKTDKFIGTIKKFYPHIFTVEVNNKIRSFNYVDIECGEIELTFI